VIRDDQPDAREGQAGRSGVAERLVVPVKPGNAGEGRGLSSRPTQDVVRDLEIGQPSKPEKCSETADGVTREHLTIPDQVGDLNAVLRGHYAYYGIARNICALQKVYRAVERYWCKMLRSSSWAGRHLTWEVFGQIKERTPLLRPKLYLPYRELQALAVL
jgi:hypothetical protein